MKHELVFATQSLVCEIKTICKTENSKNADKFAKNRNL